MTGQGASANGSTSTERAAAVLVALAEAKGGASVRAFSDSLGMSRSAVHRILQSFAAHGFAMNDENGHYKGGPKLIALAASVMSELTLVEFADAVMKRLSVATGESVYLTLLNPADGHAFFLHRIQCDKPIRYVQPIGGRVELHVGAAGRAMLAFLPREDQLRFTSGLDIDHDELDRQLEETRTRGYASSIGERIEGAAAVAVPIFRRDEVIGALSLTLPAGRVPTAGLDSFAPEVIAAGKEISAWLQIS